MMEFSDRISSAEFAQTARHPDFPNAFTRSRKLPLPALIAALLSMRNQSQQAMLDTFFASVLDTSVPVRELSDRAFAKARARLHLPALDALNDFVVRQADQAGLIQRWLGLRVVAADAAVLMPAMRSCLRVRSPAPADQRLFALYLPGAELTLHASVHSASVGERAMLVEALDLLGPDDVLVLDRGYPASWLVALLNERRIRFVMRCDSNSGWAAQRAFMRSSQPEDWVNLTAPSALDVRDWGCPEGAPRARLIRQVAPSGAIRVLVTNLDSQAFPAEAFADLYHQRWRIEEAFKRIKHRLHLEAVSGLSQHALIIDVAAKILADNITSLMCAAAGEQAELAQRGRKCKRSYAAFIMQRALPAMVLLIGDLRAKIDHVLEHLGANWQRCIPRRSRPRVSAHVKPHPSAVYK